MLNIKNNTDMETSQTTFAKQAVQECISIGFYAYEQTKHLYSSVEEWANEYANSLWENRTELDEERDTQGDVTIQDYRNWAIEEANYLIEQ